MGPCRQGLVDPWTTHERVTWVIDGSLPEAVEGLDQRAEGHDGDRDDAHDLGAGPQLKDELVGSLVDEADLDLVNDLVSQRVALCGWNDVGVGAFQGHWITSTFR